MELDKEIKRNIINLYEIPISFWQRILGKELHFHLGHFHKPNTSLEDSMRIAIRTLAMQIPRKPIPRILDVGCGWGGSAFELSRMWNAEVLGLTISRQQADFINKQFEIYKLPVQAKTVDVEHYRFDDIGTFDVLWLYEVLEHISDRRALFSNLHHASCVNVSLAIAMSCRDPKADREKLVNKFLGIQRLDTVPELLKILEETGWKVVRISDCTPLTLPVWELWAENIRCITEQEYSEQANKFAVEYAHARKLYQEGALHSVQLVAERSS